MRPSRTATEALRPRACAGAGLRRASRLGLALLAGTLALALGLTFGLRGLAGDEAAPGADLGSLLQRAGPAVAFSEFDLEADTLWAANPDDPADRVQLGRVPHALGYGIFPSLSPDGTQIAYTVLPPDAPAASADAPAELWVLETSTGEVRRLAGGVDLLVTPVWAPAGDAVVVRQSHWREDEGGSFQLLRVDMGGNVGPIATATAGLFPIDFSPDGAWLYHAAVSPEGTDLARTPAGGGEPETVARLSDGFARDWHLSPDGRSLAYLAQALDDPEVGFAAQVLDLETGALAAPLAGARVAQFNPVWEPTGALTVGRLDGGGAPVRLAVEGGERAEETPSLDPPDAGFDVPLSWSPDGAHLAVRSFEGSSPSEPGPSWVEVVGTDGLRHQLSPRSDVAIAGWLEAEP